jgi:hypothetical protein
MYRFARGFFAVLAGVVLTAALSTTAAEAQRRDRDDDRRSDRDSRGSRDEDRRRERSWELLGEKRVGFRVDRDVINLRQGEDWYRERRYRTLHFVADGNDIHMIRIRLVYLNGYGEDFAIDRLIRQGDELPIDLRGERGYIGRIEMTYRARPDFRGGAVIKVYGERSRRESPSPVADRGDWVELGCKQVSLIGRDRDTIPVGRREGRFAAIRLQVRGADVEIRDLRVVYANGDPDDIPVRNLIRADSRTRPLDLRGRERSIDQVELVYRTVLNPVDMIARQRLSQATVCVEGLQ